jgi:hypothetical protein
MSTSSFSDSASFSSQTPISAARGVISLNYNSISANYTFPTGFNGSSVGAITIADGVTVTIPSGCEWSII